MTLAECAIVAETQPPMADKAFDHGLPSLCEEEIRVDHKIPEQPKKQGCIQHGAGAVYGMTVAEHLEWTNTYVPISARRKEALDLALRAALEFEVATCPKEIDELRDAVAARWLRKVEELEGARMAWVAACPEELTGPVSKRRGPLI